MAIVGTGPPKFEGVLAKHDGCLGLVKWSMDGLDRYALVHWGTSESVVLPLLPSGISYHLHYSREGFGYLEGPPGTTQWCQPSLQYAMFTNLEGIMWCRDSATGFGCSSSDLACTSRPATMNLSLGIPAVLHTFQVWGLPYTNPHFKLWWSLPCFAKCLNLKCKNIFSLFVNKHIEAIEQTADAYGLPGTHHIRRSKVRDDPADPYRFLEDHSASTIGLLTNVIRWTGSPPHSGRLSESRVLALTVCVRILSQRFARQLGLPSVSR